MYYFLFPSCNALCSTCFRHWFLFLSSTDTYQAQVQAAWQKSWNQTQSLLQNLRFRERGPLKSWRPETMAEAIHAVLKEGLSLSQVRIRPLRPRPLLLTHARPLLHVRFLEIAFATAPRPLLLTTTTYFLYSLRPFAFIIHYDLLRPRPPILTHARPPLHLRFAETTLATAPRPVMLTATASFL